MKAVLVALTVASTLFTTGYCVMHEMPPINPRAIDKTDLTNHVKFLSHAGRGFIAGYRRGMYKDINYKNEAKCLDGETQG